MGADFADDEYGVSGRELELGRVRVEASEVVDSVNEARRATEGWMTGKECVYAGFCASFVYFVMGRPGMQVTTRGGSESMRLAASVALDGPNAFAVLDDEDGLRAVEGVRWGAAGAGAGWRGDRRGRWDWDCGGGGSSWVGRIEPADFKRKEEGGCVGCVVGGVGAGVDGDKDCFGAATGAVKARQAGERRSNSEAKNRCVAVARAGSGKESGSSMAKKKGYAPESSDDRPGVVVVVVAVVVVGVVVGLCEDEIACRLECVW